MFLQQGQGGYATVASNFIIRNDRNVYQRENAAAEFAYQRRIIKFIQPPGRVRIRAPISPVATSYDPSPGGAAWRPPNSVSGGKPYVCQALTGARSGHEYILRRL